MPATYVISRPIKEQLHCSYVRRSRTSIELQGEILAILAGLTGDAEGYEELALLVHRPTPKPKVNYLDFEPIELACRLPMMDAVAFARSDIGERDVWSRTSFVGVKEPTTPNRSLVRIEFPFIGEGS